jgi:hypothetical protein
LQETTLRRLLCESKRLLVGLSSLLWPPQPPELVGAGGMGQPEKGQERGV